MPIRDGVICSLGQIEAAGGQILNTLKRVTLTVDCGDLNRASFAVRINYGEKTLDFFTRLTFPLIISANGLIGIALARSILHHQEDVSEAREPVDAPGNPDGTARDGGLGNDIRALRKSRDYTLHDLAHRLQRSVGFVSQLERGISQPSIADLRTISEIFDVPISFFFGELDNGNEEGFVVRAGSRRKLGEGADVLEELLSPDLSGSFETLRSEFAPGASRDELVLRETEEAGYVVSGQLDLEIAGKWFSLNPGDSFRFVRQPIRWRNKGNETAVVIWVISPPVF